MSLLSQKDREMVIEALEFYIHNLEKSEGSQDSIRNFKTLSNWIRLEHFKNE